MASADRPTDGRRLSEFEPSDDREAGYGLRKLVARGGALAALGLVASQAISLVSFVVLARLAPPATFGAYAAGSILLGAGSLFTEAGMQAAVIQRSDRIQEAASTAFTANVVGGFCLAGVAAACAPMVGFFFHSGEIGRVAAVMAGTIIVNATSIVPGALLQRRFSFLFVFVQPISSVAYGVVAVAALVGGLGVWGLVVATYAATCARTTAVWLLARWRPSFGLVSWHMWRSLSAYGRPVVLGVLLREIGSVGSTALVGRALGASDLGLFRAAQRFVLQANTAIVFGSAYVLLPAFSRIWQDTPRFQESILRALRTLALLVSPLSIIFIPLGRPLAAVLLGEEWRGAGPIMMAMAGVGIALAVDSISSEAFKATGRTEILPRMHALTAIVPTALMVPLLHFGAAGMGLAVSIGMSIVAAYASAALSRVTRLPLRIILLQIRPALSAAMLMAVGVYLTERYIVHAQQSNGFLGIALLILDLLASAIFYLGSLALLSRRSLVELMELVRLLLLRGGHSASTPA